MRRAPKKQAIYKIYHKEMWNNHSSWYLAYIGSTKNLRQRLCGHMSSSKRNGSTAFTLVSGLIEAGCCKVAYELCPDMPIEEMRELEKSLITIEKPKLNVQHNPGRLKGKGWYVGSCRGW